MKKEDFSVSLSLILFVPCSGVLVIMQGNKFMQSLVTWLMLSLLLKANSMSWIIWLAMETVGPHSLVEHLVRNNLHALRA